MSKEHKPCTGHDHHLCHLMSQQFHKNDPGKYHQLVQNPEFVCKSCGRVAADKKNLCFPVQLGTWEE